jgi:tetratricopeptide (TPR) repeat protein
MALALWSAGFTTVFATPLETLAPPAPSEGVVPADLQPAVAAMGKGDVEAALGVARTFVKANPSSAVGREFLAEVLIAKGQWNEASQELAESIRIEPRRASAMVRLGHVFFKTGAYQKAETQFRQAIAIAPDLAIAHRSLAAALLARRLPGQAVPPAQAAIRLSRGADIEATLVLAAARYELGQLREAEQLLDAAAARPEASAQRLLHGIIKIDLGKMDEAVAILQRIPPRDPDSLSARLGLAIVKRARGEVAQARGEMEQVVKERPDWAAAQLELGRTLLLERKPEAALKAFDQAESRVRCSPPGSPTAPSSARDPSRAPSRSGRRRGRSLPKRTRRKATRRGPSVS